MPEYPRLSQNEYEFQNIPNDFEAIVTLDEDGLVVSYPERFERNYKGESN
ncbi:MAG: putative glycolipid-binding domain-containing protein [Cyclobacteriaceae bacterium]